MEEEEYRWERKEGKIGKGRKRNRTEEEIGRGREEDRSEEEKSIV